MKIVTVEEMRALERAAVEAGISEEQLMAEAGLALAQEAWLLLGNLEGARIVALVGPGNNGGDAVMAARNLVDWGADVVVYVATGREDDPLLQEAEEAGVRIAQASEDGAMLEGLLMQANLVFDGLLGIGSSRSIDAGSAIGETLRALAETRERGPNAPRLIAVDLPSGMNADSGAVDPLMVEPDLTVTFGLPKVGMYQAPASARVGRVQVVDIGIPREAEGAVALELLTARWARTALPDRPEQSNKGTFGKVLIVGGSRKFIGAPKLAALGAYRAGAGLVTIGVPLSVQPMLAGSIAEATWLPLPEGGDGALTGEAAFALREEWSGFEAAVVGPGCGNVDATRSLLWAILPDIGDGLSHGVVIDADGLNALATMDDGPERVPEHAVLTPHPGEMARLLGTTVDAVQEDRIAATRQAAERFGCVVVLKGAHTVVADPQRRTGLSPYANPLLASAGTGDVLSGVIAGYMAQGLAPFEAACLGVYVHAATGEALRGELGEAGLLASEIADRLPGIVREVAQP